MVVKNNTIQIYTTIDEDKVFNECYEIIKGIMEQMRAYECDEMQSVATGEVITFNDFGRMLGVLGGLPHMGIMYNSKG